MQNPQLTFSIELLGGLMEELAFWADAEEDAFSDKKFDEVLEAVRSMRLLVLEDLERYVYNVKINNEPICLNYVRVKKELERTTFQDKR